jgi:hypothetical protein
MLLARGTARGQEHVPVPTRHGFYTYRRVSQTAQRIMNPTMPRPQHSELPVKMRANGSRRKTSDRTALDDDFRANVARRLKEAREQ